MTPAPHLAKLSRPRRAQPGAAPRPAPPDGPHPGAADLGRRLAESAFAQLLPLWAAARGNPSDPFGGSLGGLSATGTATDRQFGRYLPVFWGELDLRAQRVLARHLCDTNPFAIGFLQLLKGYHVRTGFGWQACLKGPKKGAYSTGGGDPLVARAQNVLDAFRDQSQWPLKSREAFLRWRRDGEVFVRFGSGGYGRLPWARFVDPEQVGSPVGDTGTGASFGIETEDGDHETPLRYHVWDADDPTSGEWVDAARVIHLRANVDSGVKRGVTDFYALSEALDNTRRLLHTMLATAVKQARVAWVEKVAGTQQQALSAPEYAATATNRLQPYQVVDDFTRALSDQFGRFGIGGQHLSDVRRVEGSRQFEPGPAANSAGYIQVEQAALRACGVRWNFPEYFSGDASNNNMASSIVAGSPFTVTVEGNQLEYGYGFERPAALKVLELARDAGVLSHAEWARLDVEVTEPAVATPDPLKDTQVYTSQLQAKIVSLDTVRQKLGYDPRHEAEGVKKDAADQQPPQPPGGNDPLGGAGDGAQLPPDGGGGLGDPLGDALGESAEYVTEGLYALLSEADRSHLVKKQITDKLGRKRTVYVRPDEQVAAQKARGDAFRAANAGLNPKEVLQKRKADAEPARAAARAEYAKAVSEPANYDPEAMARHLERLTRDELREHARAVKARLGGLKSELVGRLLDDLKGKAGAKDGLGAAPADAHAVSTDPDIAAKFGVKQPPAAAPRRRGDETAPTEADKQSDNKQSSALDSEQGSSTTTPTPPTTGGSQGGGKMQPLSKPEPFHYTGDAELGPLAGADLRHGTRINHPQAGDAIQFAQTTHSGKSITPVVRLAGKPKLQAAWAAHEQAHQEHAAEVSRRLAANVPGLDEVRAASDSAEAARDRFAAMMGDEGNDGARMPAGGADVAAVARKYPRAALYLQAERQAELSHDDRKAGAGRRALELIRDGADLEDARKVLTNWLPEPARHSDPDPRVGGDSRRQGAEASPTEPDKQSDKKQSSSLDSEQGGSNTTPTPPTSGGSQGGSKVQKLRGSEKQVNFANTLRDKFLAKLDGIPAAALVHRGEDFAPALAALRDAVASNKRLGGADFWLDRKDRGADSLIREIDNAVRIDNEDDPNDYLFLARLVGDELMRQRASAGAK